METLGAIPSSTQAAADFYRRESIAKARETIEVARISNTEDMYEEILLSKLANDPWPEDEDDDQETDGLSSDTTPCLTEDESEESAWSDDGIGEQTALTPYNSETFVFRHNKTHQRDVRFPVASLSDTSEFGVAHDFSSERQRPIRDLSKAEISFQINPLLGYPTDWLCQHYSDLYRSPYMAEGDVYRYYDPASSQNVLNVPAAFRERVDALNGFDTAKSLMPLVGYKAHMEREAMSRLIKEKDERFIAKGVPEADLGRRKGISRRPRPWEETEETNLKPVLPNQPSSSDRGFRRPAFDENGFRKITRKDENSVEILESSMLKTDPVSERERRRRINRESARKARMRKHAYLTSLELAVQDGDLFRTIIQNATDMISVHNLDPGGTYRYVSPTYVQKSEYEYDELIGLTPYLVFEKDDHEQVMLGHQCSLLESRVCRVLYRINKKNGGFMWVETSASLTPEGIIAITRDVGTGTRTRIKPQSSAKECKVSDDATQGMENMR